MARLTQLRDHAALLARIGELHTEGHKAPTIAATLNTEGWRPPKRRTSYTPAMVRDLLHRIGVPVASRRSVAGGLETREPGEWTIDELAVRLATPRNTVHRWIQRGVVVARKLPMRAQGIWLIQADEAVLERLRHRRQHGVGHPTIINHL